MKTIKYFVCALSMVTRHTYTMDIETQRQAILQSIKSNPTFKREVCSYLAKGFTNQFNNRIELTNDGELVLHGKQKRILCDLKNEDEYLHEISSLKSKPAREYDEVKFLY
ncbi:MAG TPA: hypothetical protein VHO47_00815 [Candidatus Babeliales bacterium]|nr:hypothetical protein [Candidatus Babeliales bacterium]